MFENERPCKGSASFLPMKMTWIGEISDIKECMKEMAEHFRGNVEYGLEIASFGYPRIVLSPSSLYIPTL